MPHQHDAGRRHSSRPWAVLIAAWQAAADHFAGAAVDARAGRIAVERELFGGLCTYSSKNDDDLPATGLAALDRNRSGP